VNSIDDAGKKWLAGMLQDGAACLPESFLIDTVAGRLNSPARTTVLDAVGDTAGSAAGLRPALIDNAAIEAMLRRGRRWRIPDSYTEKAEGAEDGSCRAAPVVIEPAPSEDSWATARRVLQPTLGFFASLAVHLILLMTAALIVVHVNSSTATMLFVEGGMADADQEELVTLAAPVKEATSEAEVEAAPVEFAAVEFDAGVMQEGVPAVALVDISDRKAEGLLSDIAGLAKGGGDGLSSDGDGKGSDGDEDATGGEGTEFFGVQGQGSKFVFVCDCSGSMNGLKWMELNRELSRCISSLSAGKSFYVIFFDGEMHPMFEPFGREPALLDATTENIEKARQWIANKSLGRDTSPCDSVKFAVNLEPDAVFLLTDGEFSDYTAPYLRDFNKKRVAKNKPKVVVHTIGFFSQKHQMVLERIAKDSGGTYQFVAGPKPVKPKRKSQNVIARPVSPQALGPGLPVGGSPSGGD